MRRRGAIRSVAVLAAVALGVAGCSGDGDEPEPVTAVPSPPSVETLRVMGAPEGQLNLVARAGYTENGSNDPAMDWVTPFIESTGCRVNVQTAASSDEVVSLLRTGKYDGASVSGDAMLRLIYAGDVAPVNTDLVPSYTSISEFLKDQPWNSAGGKTYGVPHGWGVNVLMSRTDVVTPPPESWSAVFEADSPYKGKVTAFDSPMAIADAAVYLKATKPELKITNPYELDKTQLTAAVDLLKGQRELIGEYWSDYTRAVQAFEAGEAVIGTSWQVIANLVNGGGRAKVNAVVPKEGATGWVDNWSISAKAQHPVCMYKWMNWITSPRVNAQVAEWFGEAPAQTLACDETAEETHCETYHALDAEYVKQISYWTTPTKNCGDARGETCTDYADWAKAWGEIKG